MSLELKTFLVNSYGALASRYVKEAAGAEVFRIDISKRAHEEVPSFPIFVAVTGLDRCVLEIVGLPMHGEIEQLVKSKGGEMSIMNCQHHLRVTLETTDFEFVSQLSSNIQEGMALGQDDPNSNEESIKARTAESLHYFAGLLKQYSVQTRGVEKTRPDGLFAF
jgi:hypothetical protein